MSSAFQPDHIRLSDAERADAMNALGHALGEGRLSLSEYDERCREVAAAQVRADLDPLFADIPQRPGEKYPEPGQARAVQIDLDGSRCGVRYATEVNLVGDAAATLAALLPRVVCTGGLEAVWTRHRTGHAAAEGLMRSLGFAPLDAEAGWARWQMDRARLQALAATPVTV